LLAVVVVRTFTPVVVVVDLGHLIQALTAVVD
jgi:hypothetical protein